MALDKNDGVFLPSIEGVVSGKTSQVDGMNGIMNNLIGNDNYLKNKKLDKGNYIGNAESLHTDDNAIWGGEYGGYIQDTSVTKVVGKRYIDQFDGKAYECLVPSHENTIANYQACNVKDNLSKINNLIESYSESIGGYLKYADGSMEAWMILEKQTPIEGSDSYFPGMNSKNTFVPNTWGVVASPYPTSDSPSFRYTVKGTYLGFWNANGNKMFFKAIGRWK